MKEKIDEYSKKYNLNFILSGDYNEETARDFISNELVITNKYDLCKKIGIPDKKILRPGFDIEWAIERFEEKIAEIYNNFMKEWENADDTQVFIVCYLIYQDVEMYRYIWNNARL